MATQDSLRKSEEAWEMIIEKPANLKYISSLQHRILKELRKE